MQQQHRKTSMGITQEHGALSIVKVDAIAAVSLIRDCENDIDGRIFHAGSDELTKHRNCDMTYRSRRREFNFRADENSGHFGTKIMSGLIKNRLLFCRKCSPIKFGLCGSRANATLITGFARFTGIITTRKSVYRITFLFAF